MRKLIIILCSVIIFVACTYEQHVLQLPAYRSSVTIERYVAKMRGYKPFNTLNDSVGMKMVFENVGASNKAYFGITLEPNEFKVKSSDLEIRLTRYVSLQTDKPNLGPQNIFISLKQTDTLFNAFFIIWEPELDTASPYFIDNPEWLNRKSQNIITNLTKEELLKIIPDITIENVKMVSSNIFINDNISRLRLDFYENIRFDNLELGMTYEYWNQYKRNEDIGIKYR